MRDAEATVAIACRRATARSRWASRERSHGRHAAQRHAQACARARAPRRRFCARASMSCASHLMARSATAGTVTARAPLRTRVRDERGVWRSSLAHGHGRVRAARARLDVQTAHPVDGRQRDERTRRACARHVAAARRGARWARGTDASSWGTRAWDSARGCVAERACAGGYAACGRTDLAACAALQGAR